MPDIRLPAKGLDIRTLEKKSTQKKSCKSGISVAVWTAAGGNQVNRRLAGTLQARSLLANNKDLVRTF